MPISDIYILPTTYPRFDWADWPDSKAALIQGGLTADFEKEAWNALIDHIVAAQAAGGLGWNPKYTTADDAKITEAYGALSALMFNSVRYNIDHPAPLGWAWAKDKNFRGYVGREDFRGAVAHGKSGDLVYPEYIEELVRKLNLLIGIMTGEAALPFSADSVSETMAISMAELMAKASEALGVASKARSQSICAQQGVEIYTSAPIFPDEHDSTAKSIFRIGLPALFAATADLRRSLLKTRYAIYPHQRGAAPAAPVSHLARSLHEFQWDLMGAHYVLSLAKAWSTASGGLTAQDSAPTGVIRGTSVSITQSSLTKLDSCPMVGTGTAVSDNVGGIDLDRSSRVRSPNRLFTKAQSFVSRQKSANANADAKILSQCNTALDSAWWPPEWQSDGGLWIRQSHAVTIAEDGGLEVT